MNPDHISLCVLILLQAIMTAAISFDYQHRLYPIKVNQINTRARNYDHSHQLVVNGLCPSHNQWFLCPIILPDYNAYTRLIKSFTNRRNTALDGVHVYKSSETNLDTFQRRNGGNKVISHIADQIINSETLRNPINNPVYPLNDIKVVPEVLHTGMSPWQATNFRHSQTGNGRDHGAASLYHLNRNNVHLNLLPMSTYTTPTRSEFTQSTPRLPSSPIRRTMQPSLNGHSSNTESAKSRLKTILPTQPSMQSTLSTLNPVNTASSKINSDNTTLSVYSLRTTSIARRSEQTKLAKFILTLDKLERNFYLSTFTKLTAISPEDRKENGISFLQSGLFLYLLLLALSTEVDLVTKREIEKTLGLSWTDEEKVSVLENTSSWLPVSSDELKFRWCSRLVMSRQVRVSSVFRTGAARALKLRLHWLNSTESPEKITETLNQMVEEDSGGAMHDTFEEEEMSEGVCTAAVSTLYVRARWRAAPTLLNGTRPFRDAPAAVARTTRMFRINDIMRYAALPEWDAEAIEVSYATPGLSLLIVVPRGSSLRGLVDHIAKTSLNKLVAQMHELRVAVTLPLYTLRMTLLLPNKLGDLGISSLLDKGRRSTCESLKISHAVQRLMFWAEAGRNAFKDDGIEWDERPELELVVDRPYVFFVRYYNITLMNGNFVL